MTEFYYGLRDYGTASWEGGDAACDHVERHMHMAQGSTLRNDGRPKPGMQETDKTQGQAVPFKNTCGKCGARRIDQQIGLEATPEAYVAKLVEVFREVRRVLHPTGTCWINLGDSYNGSGGSTTTTNFGKAYDGKTGSFTCQPRNVEGLGPKQLLGMPWRVAFALQADGWYLRSEIIWHKKSCMPESVTDRPTKAHEQVFLLAKNGTYFYDAEAIAEQSVDPEGSAKRYSSPFFAGDKHESGGYSANGATHTAGMKVFNGTRNRRSVWTLGPESFAGAHFATFPTKLVEPMVLAGSSQHGACSACGSPWERDKEGEMWHNNRHEHIHVHQMQEGIASNGVRQGQAEEGRSPLLVPGMRLGMGEITAEKQSRESEGTGKTSEGTAQGENSRTQAPISGDRIRQSPNEGKEAGIQPDREGTEESTKKAQKCEPNGTRQDQRSDSLQQASGVTDECTGQIYGNRLDGNIGETESLLPLLQSSIHDTATSHDRSRDSFVKGRSAQSREHSSGLSSMQFPQVESSRPTVVQSWHPTCNCNAPIVPCTVLDPFSGAATVGVVALRHNRRYIGIDLNSDYLTLSEARLQQSQPMLMDIT